MLQLSLGYIVQADREREVVEDLRNRRTLLPARESRAALPLAANPPLNKRPQPIRVRSTGA